MRDRFLLFWTFLIWLTFFPFCGNAQTFNGQGGLLVPPGAPGMTVGITTSTCTVSGVGILGSGCSFLDYLTLDFTHTWVGDCALFLIAPSGQVVELSSSNGGSGDNFQITVFTDSAPLFITSGTPPYNGSFRPEGRQTNTVPPFSNTNPLGTYTFANTFNGVNADGNWTLLINDYVAIDVGVLNAWSLTFSVGGGPAPVVNLGPDLTICPGQSTILTANVSPGADSYLWNTGATSSSITVSPVSNTFYSVTVTNNDCIDVDTILVTVNTGGVTANAGVDVSICQGLAATLNGSGGGPGATYNWSTGQSGQSISVTPASTITYTLTVTDGSCSGTDQVTVTVTPIPNADAGLPVAICQGQSTTLSATGGTQNNQYTWSTGQVGSTINVSPFITTVYTVTITINGCTDTDNVEVTVNPQPSVNAGPNVQICAGESTDLIASGSTGSYQWSTGQTGSEITVAPLVTTTYTVSVTENGCTASDNVQVTVGNITAGINPDQAICEGATLILTATGGTSYVWNTGATSSSITVTPSSTTTYTVTATQGNCSDEASVVITVNPIPIANVSPDESICAGEAVILTASGGNSYQWSSGQNTSSISVSPIITTNYTVTVSSNGCSSSESVLILVNPTPNAFAGTDENICDGESVTLTATGLPGTGQYEWSTGEISASILVQPAFTSTYTVTITNEWNCFDTDAVTVFVNPFPNANAGADMDLCEGNIATLIATGGTTASSYQWSTGQTGSTINVSPNSFTTYTVTVTVAGCSRSDDVEVSVLPSPTANAGTDQEICAGASVDLSATGGDTYQWSNGQNLQTIEITPGTTTNYTVTVTSSNGCTDADNVAVVVFQNPQADAGPDEAICEGETITIVGTGGGSYEWNTGATTSSINISPTGTASYSLTVTDVNGCSDTDVVTVVVNPVPVANAGPNIFIVNGETAVLIVSGGGTYLWSTGETTDEIFVAPIETTVYSVTVTLNGCTDVDDVTVFVNESPTVDLGPDFEVCAGETVTLDASLAGPFNLEYLWSTGETTDMIDVSPSITTSYSVTVTDLISGLFSIDTTLITVHTLPIGVPVIMGSIDLCEGAITTYTVNPISGASTYSWFLPANANIISGQGTTSIDVNWGASTGGQVQLLVANDCGSLPAAIMDVNISTPPLAAGPIDGPVDPCADGSGVYSVLPVTGAVTYQWDISGGGTIVSGQGTTSVIINWNGSPGGDLSIMALNNCGSSDTVSIVIVTTATPNLSAGPDQTVCGLIAALNASGQGSWSVIAGPGTAQFSDVNDPLASLQVPTPGMYTIQYAINQNNCFAEDQVDIIFNGTPVIINDIVDCNDINTSYAVSFEISGGQPPYTINGNGHPGGIYTSGFITSGDPFSFVVTDANGCISTELTGQILCSCTSDAGSMDLAPIESCVNTQINAIYNGGGFLDGNDKLAYILHDGNIPGVILAWSQTPSFQFMPPMLTETTYFISAIIGDEGPGGLPQISDPCLAVSPGTPVRFHDIPSVVLSGDTVLCEGSCASLIQTSTGSGAIEVIYSVNGEVFTNVMLPGITSIPVCPDTTSIYTFTSLADSFCLTPVSSTVEFTIRQNVYAGSPLNEEICQASPDAIDLTSQLMDADPGGTWKEVSLNPSSAGAFDSLTATFLPISQQVGTYSFEYSMEGLDGCPGSVAIVDVIIQPVPVATAGSDETLGCNPSEILLDGSGSSGQGIQIAWSTIGGLIQGPDNTFQITAVKSGLYILSVTDSSTGCTSLDTVQVNPNNISVDLVQFETTPPLCKGDCNGIISIANAQDFLFDFGDGNFISNPLLSTACGGTFNISLMDSLGCTWDTTLLISEPSPVEVNLGPDTTILFGDSLILSAVTTSNIVDYNWFNAGNCTTCPQIIIKPSETSVYKVEVVDQNQCSDYDEILVTVAFSNQIFIPDIFSPNGDQVNDLFMIDVSHSVETIPSLEIYDRWGNKVFERKNFAPGDASAGWDGRYKGSPVNPGVYAYIIEATFKSGKTLKFAGDVTLIR